MVLFGETKDKLKATGEKAGISTIILTDNVTTAVAEAYQISHEDDIILLSPACASWDQYKNFEIRGDQFIEAVEGLE